MRGTRLQDGRGLRRPSTIDAQDLTEPGDGHVLGDIKAHDSPERAEAKEPEVERDARDQPEHGCHCHLECGAFHIGYYGRAGNLREGEARMPAAVGPPRRPLAGSALNAWSALKPFAARRDGRGGAPWRKP